MAPFAIAPRHGPEGSHLPTVALGEQHHGQNHLEPPLAFREFGYDGSGTPSPAEDQPEQTDCPSSDGFHMSVVDYAVVSAVAQGHNAPVLKALEHKGQP